jgi:D-glycero-alpha-D-manno-heptose-7-phosphate kinase
MIISRTPFRISFFGGGTDYPVWYRNNGGNVLTTTIDKYCYISCRYLPPFFEHKYRVVYSRIENVKDISEIIHPAVRVTLQFMRIEDGVEIHHDGDLPARSGLGSSSSFTVGMLHALCALKGMMPKRHRLASDAIQIEQNILKENVGSQDQIIASYGGFKKVTFNEDDTFRVIPIILRNEILKDLQSHLMLFFTGFSRYASEIAKKQIEETNNKKKELSIIQQMVDEAVTILTEDKDIVEFGKLLNESWKIKRSLTAKISTAKIDEIYDQAMRGGAVGGKLLGAGGGGFMLFFVKPENRSRVEKCLKGLLQIPFEFENEGSQIIVYQP